MQSNRNAFTLLVIVSIIATCGLIYELLAGTLASYLLGDSVLQFSTIIGVYLFAMGVGSYCSKYFKDDFLLDHFVAIEFLVGLFGGVSSMALMLIFNFTTSFGIVLYAFVFVIGALVGLEIPLLMRILKNSFAFENLVARIFTFDYLGALFASLIFPLIFVPYLGLNKTGLFFGILNVLTGIATLFIFKSQIKKYKALLTFGILCLLLFFGLFIYADRISSMEEAAQYPGKIIIAKSSPYQRIVVTRNREDIRLHLNSNLQFSSTDEHRYHEALVHPAAMATQHLKKVLVLGGGDGLAVREILKYPEVQEITMVDLDKEVTSIFKQYPFLAAINEKSLTNSKLKIVNTDAYIWLRSCKEKYDLIIVDFPDPSNYSIGKLYSHSFYTRLLSVLNDDGFASIQCTSPYAAKNTFWSIDTTIRSAGGNTIPYYNDVPSFGMWGYILMTKKNQYDVVRNAPKGLKFYTKEMFSLMRTFPKDMLPDQDLEINRLNNQSLVRLFEKEWDHYLH